MIDIVMPRMEPGVYRRDGTTDGWLGAFSGVTEMTSVIVATIITSILNKQGPPSILRVAMSLIAKTRSEVWYRLSLSHDPFRVGADPDNTGDFGFPCISLRSTPDNRKTFRHTPDAHAR